MNAHVQEIEGHRCITVADDGRLIRDAEDARAIVEEALSERARRVVIPTGRLDPEFFALRSRIAGEVLQKLVQYHLVVAIVGDVSKYVGASDAFRDFVIECNRGGDIWFVADMAALRTRLTAREPESTQAR